MSFRIIEERSRPRRRSRTSNPLDILYDLDALQEWVEKRKEAEEKKKKEKEKPKARTFTFLETVGLGIIFSLVGIPLYLLGIKWALLEMASLTVR